MRCAVAGGGRAAAAAAATAPPTAFGGWRFAPAWPERPSFGACPALLKALRDPCFYCAMFERRLYAMSLSEALPGQSCCSRSINFKSCFCSGVCDVTRVVNASCWLFQCKSGSFISFTAERSRCDCGLTAASAFARHLPAPELASIHPPSRHHRIIHLLICALYLFVQLNRCVAASYTADPGHTRSTFFFSTEAAAVSASNEA